MFANPYPSSIYDREALPFSSFWTTRVTRRQALEALRANGWLFPVVPDGRATSPTLDSPEVATRCARLWKLDDRNQESGKSRSGDVLNPTVGQSEITITSAFGFFSSTCLLRNGAESVSWSQTYGVFMTDFHLPPASMRRQSRDGLGGRAEFVKLSGLLFIRYPSQALYIALEGETVERCEADSAEPALKDRGCGVHRFLPLSQNCLTPKEGRC